MEIKGPTRARVSLPVTANTYRQLHNRVGIVIPADKDSHSPEMVRVYFTEGSIVAINMHQDYLKEV